MKTILRSIGILVLLTIVWSCEGPEGPEGPQGLQGNNGKNGTDGTNGQDGQDGNANVTSYDYPITTSDWLTYKDNTYFQDYLYYQIYPTFITSDIVSNGFVKVFFTTNNTVWLPLPFIYFGDTGDVIRYDYLYETGYVEIRIKSSSGIALDPANDVGSMTVKVIAVAGKAYALNPEIKWYNFTEFKKACPAIDKSIISK